MSVLKYLWVFARPLSHILFFVQALVACRVFDLLKVHGVAGCLIMPFRIGRVRAFCWCRLCLRELDAYAHR